MLHRPDAMPLCEEHMGLKIDACKQRGKYSDQASLSGRVVRDKTHIRVRYRLRLILL